MKNLRSITTAIFLAALITVSGCSDELISPVTQSSNSEEISSAGIESKPDFVNVKTSLKPNQIYSFNYENTGYRSFNSITVLNCGLSKGALEILGFADDEMLLLNCSSSNFYAFSISIQNLSSEEVNLDINLTGSIKKYPNPWLDRSEMY